MPHAHCQSLPPIRWSTDASDSGAPGRSRRDDEGKRGRASEKVNVLLIGGGGREHALAWKLRQSPSLGELYTDSASNPGLAALARPCSAGFNPRDTYALEQFCQKQRIGLVVVGPEEPLAQGIADILLGTRAKVPAGAILQQHGGGLRGAVGAVFGPAEAAARLEADKAFAKELMRHAAIPTAEGQAFNDPEAAREYLRSREHAPVIKASGLCKGKGVFLPSSLEEGLEVIERVMVRREFGEAGSTVIIEERLKGREVSVFAITDGRTIVVLDVCQDHKRLQDGARGPNTGGMGAVCPPPQGLDDRMMDRIQREVLVATVDALRREGIEYRGVLYAGLMLTPAGPKVLEFNVRFGDPECQVLMMRMDTDLVRLLGAAAGMPGERLDRVDISFRPGAAVCVVMAAPGYPDAPRAGVEIRGLEEAAGVEGVQIFHAGTRRDRGADGEDRLVSAGGRVLNVCAWGATHAEARERAAQAVRCIHFPGAMVRTDIGTEVVG